MYPKGKYTEEFEGKEEADVDERTGNHDQHLLSHRERGGHVFKGNQVGVNGESVNWCPDALNRHAQLKVIHTRGKEGK